MYASLLIVIIVIVSTIFAMSKLPDKPCGTTVSEITLSRLEHFLGHFFRMAEAVSTPRGREYLASE
ncbi:MAG TPA: hypothetical protein VNJ07_04345 [Chitinophagales bacterium]|nr:hypothetical protein [Chitinophagales bacterium]